jgi:hypothetical protein
MKRKSDKKKEAKTNKKIAKKRVVIKKKEIINKNQLLSIKEEKEDIKKPKFNFNLITGIMIFILLIGASFSTSLVFGIAFTLCFIISVYNKILEGKPFLPLILFFIGITIRIVFILGFPSLLKSKIYLDLIISLIILIIIFLMSFRIRKK